MIYDNLGKTDIKVSKICLGTMTWGHQNTYEDAVQQINYAIEQGVNFIDTAEIYCIPNSEEKYGATETIIGQYFQNNPGVREKLILASKISSPNLPYIRDGRGLDDLADVTQAVDDSLKRLQTDYIDLYQIHWSTRNVPKFGVMDFKQEWVKEEEHIEAALTNLSALVKTGKIRTIGLSNESAWGTQKFLYLAEKMGLERIVSVQNSYNLIARHYDVDMAEVSYREKVGLLAYSPLAGGILSGKYRNGQRPDGARLTTWGGDRYAQYQSNGVFASTDEYYELATKNNMTLAQLALAWVNQQPWVTSNIIGATSMEQLTENISSINYTLSDEIIAQINAIHEKYRNPTAIVNLNR